jgi:hypothetical protein
MLTFHSLSQVEPNLVIDVQELVTAYNGAWGLAPTTQVSFTFFFLSFFTPCSLLD